MSVYFLKWQRTHPPCLPNEFFKIMSNVSSLFKSLIMPRLPSVSFPLIYLVWICKVLNFSFQEYIVHSVFCFLFHDIPCSAHLGCGFYFILFFLRSMLAYWLFFCPQQTLLTRKFEAITAFALFGMLDEIFLITLPFISYEEGLGRSCFGWVLPLYQPPSEYSS